VASLCPFCKHLPRKELTKGTTSRQGQDQLKGWLAIVSGVCFPSLSGCGPSPIEGNVLSQYSGERVPSTPGLIEAGVARDPPTSRAPWPAGMGGAVAYGLPELTGARGGSSRLSVAGGWLGLSPKALRHLCEQGLHAYPPGVPVLVLDIVSPWPGTYGGSRCRGHVNSGPVTSGSLAATKRGPSNLSQY
jgi:hypothetical protein